MRTTTNPTESRLLPTRTDCFGCDGAVTLDFAAGTATVRVPSKGSRGRAFVAAHDLVTDLGGDGEPLVEWDCPSCGHAESFDLEHDAR